MSSTEYDVCCDDPLPPGDGPRLAAFKHRHEPVKILKLLSIPQSGSSSEDSTGQGGFHAHVFQARIRRTSYALKVFKFQSTDDLRRDYFPHNNYRVDDATITFQSDPFFAECRAYGRIEEYYRRKRKTNHPPKDVVVPCFGFMDLPTDPFEQIFRKEFEITEWNRPAFDQKLPAPARAPFRTLVKKLVLDKPAITDPSKMLRDLRTLRKIGVFHGDVAGRNYIDGLFVDFSLSWTLPHWIVPILAKFGDRWERLTRKDLSDFDAMMEESGLKIGWRIRASRNLNLIRRLRPRKREKKKHRASPEI